LQAARLRKTGTLPLLELYSQSEGGSAAKAAFPITEAMKRALKVKICVIFIRFPPQLWFQPKIKFIGIGRRGARTMAANIDFKRFSELHFSLEQSISNHSVNQITRLLHHRNLFGEGAPVE
jgi:hypothetical protein